VRTGLGVAGAAVREALGGSGSTRGSDARESEKREKERAGRILYPLMFIGPTHQPTNISRVAYVAAMVPYVRVMTLV
jgi:hypothetical protein